MARKKGFYWTEVEDKYFIQWFKGTEKEKVQAYNNLVGKLNFMAKNILYKYYPQSLGDYVREKELIDDAVNHLLLSDKYETGRASIYSYASVVIKHKFHDMVVMRAAYTKNIIIDKNYDTTSAEHEYVFNDYCETPDFDEFDYAERELTLKRINNILNKKRDVIVNRLEKLELNKHKRKNKNTLFIKNYQNRLKVINAIIEYFNKYFMESKVSGVDLTDYVRQESGLGRYYVCEYMIEFVNTFSEVYKMDAMKSKRDAKITSYIQDDIAPNEKAVFVGRKSAMKTGHLSKKFTNEELSKYNYF